MCILYALVLLAVSAGPTAVSGSEAAGEVASAGSEGDGGSVNTEALQKLKRKKAWKQARPFGCKEGKGDRWCELHDDTSLTLRNVARLQRLLDEIENRAADVEVTEEMEGEDKSATTLMEAVKAAAEKYSKDEKKRRKEFVEKEKKKNKKMRKKPPATRLPQAYKCRKLESKKEAKELSNLKYRCTVTDYTFEKAEVEGKGKDAKEKETDAVRCKRLLRWKNSHGKDLSRDTKGELDYAAFWAELAGEHDGFGVLTKLWHHSVHSGADITAKVKAAFEKKAAAAYKAMARGEFPPHSDRPA
eukprot:SAG11_NODE_2867_length_2890_cov_1.583662_4_plen_301_part_00